MLLQNTELGKLWHKENCSFARNSWWNVMHSKPDWCGVCWSEHLPMQVSNLLLRRKISASHICLWTLCLPVMKWEDSARKAESFHFITGISGQVSTKTTLYVVNAEFVLVFSNLYLGYRINRPHSVLGENKTSAVPYSKHEKPSTGKRIMKTKQTHPIIVITCKKKI